MTASRTELRTAWITMPLFAAGRTRVGARFIVHSFSGGRGEATPLPSAALRRPSDAPSQLSDHRFPFELTLLVSPAN